MVIMRKNHIVAIVNTIVKDVFKKEIENEEAPEII
jgi:hypothetical protein